MVVSLPAGNNDTEGREEGRVEVPPFGKKIFEVKHTHVNSAVMMPSRSVLIPCRGVAHYSVLVISFEKFLYQGMARGGPEDLFYVCFDANCVS